MAPAASAEVVYGVTDSNKLVSIDSTNPNAVSAPLTITGIATGDSIKAIDVRPATLQLYALGAGGQLYKIDTVTGAATSVGVPLALTGTDFDIDFNPTVDRLRVVSDGEQNLRVNPNTAAVTVDGALNPAGNVTGAAYTNNAPASYAYQAPPAAPTTTLFDIDTGSDQLLTQTPPNAGTLTAGKALGVDLVGDVGFDISTAAAALGGVGANTAYAVGRTADTNDRLYSVNLDTGAAAAVGELAGADKIKDIAVVPALPQLAVVYTPVASADPQQLVTVRADRPGAANTPVNVSGLQSGERLVGIDRRPTTGVVFGFGSTGRLYTLNLATGAATQVGSGTLTLAGTSFGFDFNPTVDRVRFVSDADTNARANPDTGARADTAPADGNLAYAMGDPNAAANPNVTAAGYTPAPLTVPPAAAAPTTLFDVDTTLDVLATQAPPNNGTLNTVVNPSGTNGLGVEVTDNNGFDIAARFNHEFGAFQPTTGVPTLYAVNASSTAPVAPATLGPANGTAAAIGALGGLPAAGTIAGMTIVNDDIAPAAPAPVVTPVPTPPVTTPTPTVTVVPTATPKPYVVKKRPGLTGKARPKRDRKKPFRFRVSGKLPRPSGVSRAAGCKGTVRITVKRGSKTLAKTTTKLRSTCSYSKVVKLNGKKAGRRGTARFSISFRGNSKLLAKTITRSAKYGRKK